MVVDTAYYDALGVSPTATELEIKKAYRKMAIQLHPDKNPGDATAHEKFQVVGEAYQILSDKALRGQYDKYGKEQAMPSSGFEDPSEFFSMIFGGDAFGDWIGELSLLKDLTKTMDITMREEEEQAAAEASSAATAAPIDADLAAAAAASMAPPDTKTPLHATATDSKVQEAELPPVHKLNVYDEDSPAPSGTSTPRPSGIPTRLALDNSPHPSTEHLTAAEQADMTEEEKRLREKQKKKGVLTKEQREELAAYELERKKKKDERVNQLSEKLVSRMNIWTETDKGRDVTEAFKAQIQLEIENLKMESFGIEILHAIGATYLMKGTSFLKSQKLFGFGGFWSRLKEKGNLAKETWTTISTAMEATATMQEMEQLQEKGGEDWTDEKKAEYERKVTGKILAAAWRGSKYEIQSVLREVCEKVLNAKDVRLEKRVERAQGLVIIGEMFSKAARSPDEQAEWLEFEQLVAEAQIKKEKDTKKKEKAESVHTKSKKGESSSADYKEMSTDFNETWEREKR